jgi:hypothetical protein
MHGGPAPLILLSGGLGDDGEDDDAWLHASLLRYVDSPGSVVSATLETAPK